jgi:DNA (cytosine-5)-methyltransferase 1
MPGIVELFAGPGGWAEGLRLLGLDDIGIDWDHAAVATRTAAGHTTVLADVAALDPHRFIDDRGIVLWGLIASPPCPLWSTAGKGQGRRYGLPIMASALAGLVAGRDTRPAARAALADLLEPDVAAEHPDWVDQLALPLPGISSRVRAEAERLAAEAALVLEPARWARALRPTWIALEQVPACLPIWEALGSHLDVLGYQSACAVLNCADYGVPQTRKRAIFVAQLDAQARLPAPTHADPRAGDIGDLAPWVTMAQALGWDGENTDSPARTVCGDRVPRWMYPSTGDDRRGRVVVATGANSMVTGRTGSRAGDEGGEPSFTVTEKARSWKLIERQPNGAQRSADEPAMTITSSADNGNYRFVLTGRDWDQWAFYRPATTIAGDSRVWAPGHKINADDIARLGEAEATDRYGDRAGTDAIRLEVHHALALQSFRTDYPVKGNKTEQFRQVGDAVPPLFAAHIVASLTGLDLGTAA